MQRNASDRCIRYAQEDRRMGGLCGTGSYHAKQAMPISIKLLHFYGDMRSSESAFGSIKLYRRNSAFLDVRVREIWVREG